MSNKYLDQTVLKESHENTEYIWLGFGGFKMWKYRLPQYKYFLVANKSQPMTPIRRKINLGNNFYFSWEKYTTHKFELQLLICRLLLYLVEYS